MALSTDLFKPLQKREFQAELIRPSTTYWQDAWRRLKKNPVAMGSLILIILILLVAIFGPCFRLHLFRAGFCQEELAISAAHWFGTDGLGRIFHQALRRQDLFQSVFGCPVAPLGVWRYLRFAGGYGQRMMRFVDIIWYLLLWVIAMMVYLER